MDIANVQALIQAIIFLVLSLLHLHWAFGGSWGFEYALPTNKEGEKLLNPSKSDSLIVGVGLALFAIFYLIQGDFATLPIPHWLHGIIAWLIPSIFLLRAMGDFKYIGFFKKVTSTPFGQRDSKFFSPLCLFLAANGILIELMR